MLEDLESARAALVWALDQQGAGAVPIHVYANCFGTRIVLPYLCSNPGQFKSVILTAPATSMSRKADYGPVQRAAILVAPPKTYFASPLRDEYFVSRGPWLEWIRADQLSLRRVTAGFLQATASLDFQMKQAAQTLTIPMLVILGSQDVMVRNDKIRCDFVQKYKGPSRVVELNGEHYLEFTGSQPALVKEIRNWILTMRETSQRGQ
jgi:pimeloyl-ACP methyl ester carboxylesterase